MEDYDNSEGKYYRETRTLSIAYWIRDSTSGQYITDTAEPRNIVWAVSEYPSATSLLELSEKPWLSEFYEVNMNLTQLW